MTPHSTSCWTRWCIVRHAHQAVMRSAASCSPPASQPCPAVVWADTLSHDVAAPLGLAIRVPGTCSPPAGQPRRGFHELVLTRWLCTRRLASALPHAGDAVSELWVMQSDRGGGEDI
ncbi:MAG: hypothetical protein KatS3mg054_0562 [Chloroflexus sp.]|nr:MAG: hypothetical protein KatS3mg054_0562 [Chloroflexus sp.]GIV91715.1 MAG: hypothetical protein KatS3mg056_0424 [Chloroflexus sp.]